MKTTSNSCYCPYCGSECGDEDRRLLDALRAKAKKAGCTVRCKAGRKGLYEVLDDTDAKIAEGTSANRIAAFLDALSVPLVDEVRA